MNGKHYGYIITNNITGKLYVGTTSRTIALRWIQHKYDSKNNKKYFYCSMRKYGIGNFSIEEQVCFNNKEDMHQWEIDTIQELNTQRPNGYNLSIGGESSSFGCKKTKEQKKKLSKTKKQYHIDHPENAKNIAEKREITLKNNPDITEKAAITRSKTFNKNPDIMKNARIKQNKTFNENPDILIDGQIKRQAVLNSKEWKNSPKSIGKPIFVLGGHFHTVAEAVKFLGDGITHWKIINAMKKMPKDIYWLIKGHDYPWEIIY